MNLNFLIREMTHLRYFVPIVQEGNKRGLQSKFLITNSNKYNCPFSHLEKLKLVCEENNIEIVNNMENLTGLFFVNETSGIDIANKIVSAGKCKLIVTTYQTDFTACYDKYVKIADHILMPSKNIAKYYKLENKKNLYVGIPKYDIELDRGKIVEKYSLNKKAKRVLVMWPKSRDMHKFPIDIIDNFDQLGWQVLVKARAKDPIQKKTKQELIKRGNLYFYDDWYPHTSQELLEVSDLVINCGSTTIEECVMHEVPLINFDIKPEIRHGTKQKYRVTHDYLYNYKFCITKSALTKDFNSSTLNAWIQYLYSQDLKSEFKKCKDEWLYDHKDTCKRLLNVLL